MEKIIFKVVNAIAVGMITMIAGLMTFYSVIWLWTFISPRANFETGPIGLACKIVAIATIIVTAWFVPESINFLLKHGKKYFNGELKTVPIKVYMDCRRENKKLVELSDNLTKSLNYHILLTKHYKLLSEEYKKELDALESAPEE